ncbi:MAG TPA: MFS transporter [Mycobacteriales bacterium]|nr:MFS transporter [Mycobacteriales bacterium]
MTPPRYRWVVLAAGAFAQASSAAVLQSLPGLAPQLRDEFGLQLTGLGVLLASVTVGLVATLLLWGAAADRFGERRVMAAGLVLVVAALLAVTRTSSVGPLMAWLTLAGAACGSVNAASGRAVLGWFPPAERGLAMGLRQTSLPLGAGLAAALLPPLAQARGLDAAFLAMAGAAAVSAVVVVALVREAPGQLVREPGGASPLRDPAVRRLSLVSFLLVVPQFTVVAFVVVYLVDEQAFAVATAALVLAAVQVSGGLGRVVAGRWSDRLGSRLVPLRRIALAVTGLFVVTAALDAAGTAAVVPLLVVAGVVAISWNGLAFTAVGELAGPGRAGTALGAQNTAVAVSAAVTPPLVALVVSRSSWAAGYLLAAGAAAVAVLLLRPAVGTPPPSRDAAGPRSVARARGSRGGRSPAP